jgi:hypothetical protein
MTLPSVRKTLRVIRQFQSTDAASAPFRTI